MDLDQPATVEDLDQMTVAANMDMLPDQMVRNRVKGPADLDVEVTVDFGLGVQRQLIEALGGRQQAWLLLLLEALPRSTLSGAVNSLPGRLQAPAGHPEPGLFQAGESLPSETTLPAVADAPLYAWLVGWPPHPSRVQDEAARLGILQKGGIEAGRDRVQLDHDRSHAVRDHDPEDAAEEGPGLFETLNHRRQRLFEAEPAEHVAAVASGKDEPPTEPPTLATQVEEQAHPTEVDLQFGAWLPVHHPDRVLLAARAQLLNTEAVQSPVGHADSPTHQQAVDLGQLQLLPQPLLQPAAFSLQLLPSQAATAVSAGAQLLCQHPQ